MAFELHTDELLVNMGPQHPSTHGVLRLVLRLDGEIVLQADPQIGYLHRSAEKEGENLSVNQFIPYTDRMDYVGAMNNNFGLAVAAEDLLECTPPKRAQYIRVCFAELNRIASHLVALGTYGIDMGAFTPFLFSFIHREKILDIFEKMVGARLTYSFTRVGGVVFDITDEIIDDIIAFCDYFPAQLDELNNLLSFNRIFVDRTANVGVISREDCIDWGVTGPPMRATGLGLDLRKRQPYSSYEEFDFEVAVGTAERGELGDCWNRYYVRVKEMTESLKIIRQSIDKIKGTEKGDIRAPLKKVIRLPKNEVYSRTESPRGELGFYIQGDGTDKPYRLKIRTPSFCTLSGFESFTKNMMLADVVAVLGSIDIVLGDVDR